MNDSIIHHIGIMYCVARIFRLGCWYLPLSGPPAPTHIRCGNTKWEQMINHPSRGLFERGMQCSQLDRNIHSNSIRKQYIYGIPPFCADSFGMHSARSSLDERGMVEAEEFGNRICSRRRSRMNLYGCWGSSVFE